jgi:hypothetical protein
MHHCRTQSAHAAAVGICRYRLPPPPPLHRSADPSGIPGDSTAKVTALQLVRRVAAERIMRMVRITLTVCAAIGLAAGELHAQETNTKCIPAWKTRAEAETYLREVAGLYEYGDRWSAEEDRRLARLLTQTKKARAELETVQRSLEAAILNNRRVWQQRTLLAKHLEDLIRIRSNTAVATTETYTAIKRLQYRLSEPPLSTAVTPKQIGELPQINRQARAGAAARARGVLLCLQLDQELAAVVGRYDELATDAAAQAAAAFVGGRRATEGSSLIAPRRPLKLVAREIEVLTAFLMTDEQSYYLAAGVPRTVVIVAEQYPLTVTLRKEEPHWITASAAERIGLTEDRGAARAVFSRGERKITVRRATLTNVRVGRFLSPRMQVWVLPPEAEDLGNSLALSAIGSRPGVLDPEQLRLSFSTGE